MSVFDVIFMLKKMAFLNLIFYRSFLTRELFIAKQHTVNNQNDQSNPDEKEGVPENSNSQHLSRSDFF